MKILVFGMINYSQGVKITFDAFKRLGHEIRHVPYRKLCKTIGEDSAFVEACNHIIEFNPDVLWLFNNSGSLNKDRVKFWLNMRPQMRTVWYSFDDPLYSRTVDADSPVSLCDIAFTCSLESTSHYLASGIEEAYYMPPAMDTNEHTPLQDYEINSQYESEVSFTIHGLYREDKFPDQVVPRKGLVEAFIDSELDVAVFGSDREPIKSLKGFRGLIPFNEIRKSMASLIHINSHVVGDGVYYMNYRTAMITGCGGFMLCDRANRINEIYLPGIDAEYYSSIEEALEKARFYVQHPEKAKIIGERARKKSLEWTSDHAAQFAIRCINGEGPQTSAFGLPSTWEAE